MVILNIYTEQEQRQLCFLNTQIGMKSSLKTQLIISQLPLHVTSGASQTGAFSGKVQPLHRFSNYQQGSPRKILANW